MKQMVVGSAEAWRQAGADLAAKGANASAAEVASFLQMTHRVSMIHSEFLGQRAEVGRALNAMKTISDASKNIKELDLLLRKEGGTANIMEIAKLAAETENPAQAAAVVKAAIAPTALDKVIEVFKAFTLSGLTTHMANILGNVSGMFVQPIDRAVAAGVGKALGTPDRVRLAEVPAEVNGMVHGTLDGLRLAGEIIRGRQPIGDKVDLTSGAIGGRTGEVVRVPFKLLTAEDALFRTMAERGEAYALATRQAFKERLTPGTREYDNRIVELVANPPEAMAEAIAEQGHRAVFTTKLGTRGTHLQLLVRGSLFEFVLPYLRTPINLFKWAVEHTPAGFMMKEVRDAFAAGGVQRDMAVARMIVGGVIGTIVFAGVKDGVVTGSGLTEPEKMRAKRAAGWQPYSFKIGDKYYSYQRLDPVARLIATAADVGELWETADTGQRPEIAATVMASIGNATISQTYLSGLANAVNAITDPTRYGKRWIDQYAASMVPGLIGQMAVAKDPYVREINTVLDAVQSRIPIWRESLLPKRNPLTGEAVKAPESLFPFAPIRVSQESHDKVLTEAARLGIPLGNAPKAIGVGKNTGKIGKIELSDEQRNAFTEEQGKLAYHYLKPLVDSPWWDALRDVEKTMVYHKVLKKVRVQAGATVLPPEARAAEIPRILDEMLGPDASTSGVGQ
jgi:hypothetical protein